jgi:hypothetical protein
MESFENKLNEDGTMNIFEERESVVRTSCRSMSLCSLAVTGNASKRRAALVSVNDVALLPYPVMLGRFYCAIGRRRANHVEKALDSSEYFV